MHRPDRMICKKNLLFPIDPNIGPAGEPRAGHRWTSSQLRSFFRHVSDVLSVTVSPSAVSPPNSFTLSHTSDTSSAGCLPSGKPATREIGLNCLLRLIDCDDRVVSVFRSASLFRTRPETLPAPVDRRSSTPAGLSPPPKFGVSSPSPPFVPASCPATAGRSRFTDIVSSVLEGCSFVESLNEHKPFTGTARLRRNR